MISPRSGNADKGGLIQRIAHLFWRSPQVTSSPESTTSVGYVDMLRAMGGMGDPFGVGLGRVAIHNDIQRMIDTDPTIDQGLLVWASNVCAPGGEDQTFEVSCEDDKARALMEQCIERLEANTKSRSWTYDLKAFGNLFLEVVVSDQSRVESLKALPEEQMQIRRDAQGNLGWTTDPQGNPIPCAPYVQVVPGDYMGKGIEFDLWQVLHAGEPPEDRGGYGKSRLTPVRRAWKSLQYIDEAMVMARIERAFLKYIYTIPMQVGSSDKDLAEKIKRFKDSVTRQELMASRGDTNTIGTGPQQVSVTTDKFLASLWTKDEKGTVQTIKPDVQIVDPQNRQLTTITDVEHQQHKVLVALGVPPGLLGYEDKINAKATLDGQTLQFYRRVKDLQSALKRIMRRVCDLELMLNGYVPGSVEYDILLPEISITDMAAAANTELTRAETARILNELGALDEEAVATHFSTLTADEWAEIQKRIEAKVKAEPEPPVVPVMPTEGLDPELREYFASGQAADDMASMAELMRRNGHKDEDLVRVG